MCSIFFYEADKNNLWSQEKSSYVLDVSGSSNNKTTGLKKNEKRSGKLGGMMTDPSPCHLKGELNAAYRNYCAYEGPSADCAYLISFLKSSINRWKNGLIT